jgi:hypothetical protein
MYSVGYVYMEKCTYSSFTHSTHKMADGLFFCHSDWIGYVKNKCMEHVWMDGWKLYTKKRITTQPTL